MKKVNYGIELGRIITMIMIMTLHILYQGGLLGSLNMFTLKGQSLIFLEYLALVAVNIFGLITGYVMVNGKYKPKRIINLWLQVIFYSYLLLVIIIPIKKLNLSLIATSVLPTLRNGYWYFNSYLILFLFIPFLNKGLRTLTKNELFKIILIMFFVLSFLSSLTAKKMLYVDGGYSPIWLIYLYIIGAYIKLYPPKKIKNNSIRLIKYICLTILMVFLHDGLNICLMIIKGSREQYWGLLRYSFPVILFMSIYLFVYLINLEFKDKVKKIITSVSRHSFAAYLLQTNVLVFTLFLKNMYGQFISLNTILLILFIILNALLFYVIAIGVDKIRFFLFKLLRIGELTDKLLSIFKNILKSFLKLIGY